MKYRFVFSIFFMLSPLLNAGGILEQTNFNLLPKSGFVRANLVAERVELGNKGEDIESTRTVSELNTITSLSDGRVILEFIPMQLYQYGLDKSQEPILSKVYCTFVNDGTIWKSMLFKPNNNGGMSMVQTTISSKVPVMIASNLNLLDTKSFFVNFFNFFETGKLRTSFRDILSGNHKFPKWKVTRKENLILCDAETLTNIYQSRIEIYKTNCIVRNYLELFKANEKNAPLKIELNSSGYIPVENIIEMYIAKKIEKTVFSENSHKGYKISLTLNSIKYYESLDFEKEIPEIPPICEIRDEDKRIIYRKSQTKEDILKSIRRL